MDIYLIFEFVGIVIFFICRFHGNIVAVDWLSFKWSVGVPVVFGIIILDLEFDHYFCLVFDEELDRVIIEEGRVGFLKGEVLFVYFIPIQKFQIKAGDCK